MEGVQKKTRLNEAKECWAKGEYETTVKLLEEAEEDGEALCLLGMAYNEGVLGLKMNSKKAHKYFRKSAKSGCAWGMLKYGVMIFYTNYLIIPHKERDANKWFKRAFDNGDAYVKAYCYYSGWHVPKDRDKALELYFKALDEGHIYATQAIAYYYYYNNNDKEAFLWFLKGANQEHGECQELVGDMLLKGNGVERNLTMAWKWLKKAVKNRPSSKTYTSKEFVNFDLHENCRNSLLCLIGIRKYKKNLIVFPLDIVILITRILWNTRNEQCWKF
jgi:TPR repeat protein